jgi:hypothetical protein
VSAVVRPQPTLAQTFAVIEAALPLATSFYTTTHLNESIPFRDPCSDLSKVGAADTANAKAYTLVAELDRRSVRSVGIRNVVIRDLVLSFRF